MKETIRITEETAGERIDALLPKFTPELSRTIMQRLIVAGDVTVNGLIVRKNYIAQAGDEVSLTFPEPDPTDVDPEDIPLDVVYEDDDLIVINKQRGLVVHPAAGHRAGTLVNALIWHCGRTLSGIGGETRPGIVHRIDKDTSGLLVCAKNDLAHKGLAAQLMDHSLARTYEAVVFGEMKHEEGTIDQPIGRCHSDRKRMAVVKDGRPSVTHYKVLKVFRGFTHVQCNLETGRTHQIRVHMDFIGHPLVGDMVYGRRRPALGLEGQCLHARSLRFVHPRTGEQMTLDTELPAYFQQVLSRLG